MFLNNRPQNPKKLTVTNIFMEIRVLPHYAVKWFFYIFRKTYWVTFQKWTRKM